MRSKSGSSSRRVGTDPSDVAERLHSGAIRILRMVRAADVETGVSGPKLSALSVLVFGGPMTLKALAAAEQVRPPTMSRLVADLEEEGLAVKRPDPADGRSVRIEATPKGRALMEEGKKRRLAILRARLQDLAPGELTILDEAANLLARVGRGR